MGKWEDDFLRRLFADSPPDDLYWSEIKRFLEGLGGTVSIVTGAPVRVRLNGRIALFQHIYPDKPAVVPEVLALRELLEVTGFWP